MFKIGVIKIFYFVKSLIRMKLQFQKLTEIKDYLRQLKGNVTYTTRCLAELIKLSLTIPFIPNFPFQDFLAISHSQCSIQTREEDFDIVTGDMCECVICTIKLNE